MTLSTGKQQCHMIKIFTDCFSVTIRDDDDILPLLLEEFPHLHLSLHTWHELWRKGLTQIEQITRAHQEVRRKKTRAQAQVIYLVPPPLHPPVSTQVAQTVEERIDSEQIAQAHQ